MNIQRGTAARQVMLLGTLEAGNSLAIVALRQKIRAASWQESSTSREARTLLLTEWLASQAVRSNIEAVMHNLPPALSLQSTSGHIDFSTARTTDSGAP